MEYQTIFTIKESEKATVELAALEGQTGPVIIKKLRGVSPNIYRLLCCVQNLHIPKIYAYEQQDKEFLVAEEYVDGENLEEYVQKHCPGDKEKLQLALQLCEAVRFLHLMEPPIIHRDIKPSNILITGKGILKLIDFDASRQYKVLQNSGDTRLLGTAEYAAPEQFGYSQTDVRSDIYSMGVVFNEMNLRKKKSRKKSQNQIHLLNNRKRWKKKKRLMSPLYPLRKGQGLRNLGLLSQKSHIFFNLKILKSSMKMKAMIMNLNQARQAIKRNNNKTMIRLRRDIVEVVKIKNKNLHFK